MSKTEILSKIHALGAAVQDAVVEYANENGITAEDVVGGSASVMPAGYREDGFSEETSYGCRRHISIDRAMDVVNASNHPFAAEALANVDFWLGFPPQHHPELVPEDPEEFKWLNRGVSQATALRRWGILSYDYRWYDPAQRKVVIVPDHRILYEGPEVIPARRAEQIAKGILTLPNRLQEAARKREEEERLGIERPDASPVPNP